MKKFTFSFPTFVSVPFLSLAKHHDHQTPLATAHLTGDDLSPPSAARKSSARAFVAPLSICTIEASLQTPSQQPAIADDNCSNSDNLSKSGTS